MQGATIRLLNIGKLPYARFDMKQILVYKCSTVTVHYISFLLCHFLATESLKIERSSLLFFVYFN